MYSIRQTPHCDSSPLRVGAERAGRVIAHTSKTNASSAQDEPDDAQEKYASLWIETLGSGGSNGREAESEMQR
ncbi:UNVERIFIED_CONTAM: hypothetical protein Sradi_7262500 [Sesamum radiatum]|uniref:Uncharacterized protein n=1 Tax=Sesamum radiatum TaxID=300843 RepID=A0AAW2IKL8_SESRA